MFYAFGPAQVADVYQPVNALFDLDEGSEVRQIADASFDRHTHGEFLMQRIPRVGCQLPHAQRNAALRWVHIEHDTVHLISNVDQLRGMLHALRPRHLADVDQALDALLKFDECAVIGDADHAAAHMGAHGIGCSASSHGSGVSCLNPKETRCFSLSYLRTFT